MDKVLRGILRFNAAGKAKFTRELKQLGHKFKPQTVMICCMDSRVNPSTFVDFETGQIFMMRNAGNIVPHYRHYVEGNMIGMEGAGLELGVILNGIKNIVVCGHSDCKAVNLLYDLRDECNYLKYKNESPLKTWVTLHGCKSVNILKQILHKHSFGDSKEYKPMVCSFNIGDHDVTAQIDPENEFSIQDKFSQLHCLQQAHHFSSYPFLDERMKEGKLNVFAMWFDLHKGDVHLFRPCRERFVVVNESNVDEMIEDVTS